MAIERYQPEHYDLIPMRAGASAQEIRGLERTARVAIFMAQLDVAIKALRLAGLERLASARVEKHISVGTRITNEIIENDNPLIEDALLETWEDWKRDSRQLTRGGASF